MADYTLAAVVKQRFFEVGPEAFRLRLVKPGPSGPSKSQSPEMQAIIDARPLPLLPWDYTVDEEGLRALQSEGYDVEVKESQCSGIPSCLNMCLERMSGIRGWVGSVGTSFPYSGRTCGEKGRAQGWQSIFNSIVLLVVNVTHWFPFTSVRKRFSEIVTRRGCQVERERIILEAAFRHLSPTLMSTQLKLIASQFAHKLLELLLA
ncbi:hypothetical protein BDV98DRAFT_258901 [Pterulicium gracile]|uniref:Uncharacterized protein n=1 Tax=Pterulicium gracile TaxID=1884261 RepID=A0A5C3Q6Y6_9AGAR|nr:hypothetical protein BDV98DRAFT_258901 [Pterula gracilis]